MRVFQSTRPHGARLCTATAAPNDYIVSIHAPAWGATQFDSTTNSFGEFQSTRPHGARRIYRLTSGPGYKFQSTRPHGARLNKTFSFVHRTGFNPRARMGRDRNKSLFDEISVVSIHAPAWGATIYRLSRSGALPVSIHAPAWGATC